MRVSIEKTPEGKWKLYVVPEDEIERGIITQIDGGTLTLGKDVKLHNGHIPDCLIIDQTRQVVRTTNEVVFKGDVNII